ncbi:hypothetical protein BX666DRAFT_2025476 [Dichotomocladium elegans]|nr:hypothetical protein BX666DRAFT_2025476 [Dichotomocladium elegans]
MASSNSGTNGVIRSTSNRSLFLGENEEWNSRNLSSDYQEIQKRTLTKWVNTQLTEPIGNMETDLRDGKQLLKLLAAQDPSHAPKPERGNMRIHQLSNVAQAFGFLQKHFRDVPDIGNEAIVNGNMKGTVTLISYIMLKYHFQSVLNDPALKASVANGTSSSSSALAEAKIALLRWVRIQLGDYLAARIIPPVQDFSRAWRTGVAFCLLIHRHDPELVPVIFNDYLLADTWTKEQWHEMLNLAFTIAAEKMKIPRYLEPEDFTEVEYPHEASVMLYVGEYYKVMTAAQKSEPDPNKAATAAKRKEYISKLLKARGFDDYGDQDDVEMKQKEELALAVDQEIPRIETSTSFTSTACSPVAAQTPIAMDSFITECNDTIQSIEKETIIITSPAKLTQALSNLDNLKEQLRLRTSSVEEMSWNEIDKHIEITRERLKQLRADWEKGEQDVLKFQQKANVIENEMKRAQDLLDKAYPTATNENDQAGSTVIYPVHPLESTHKAASQYEQTVIQIAASIEMFNSTAWDPFEEFVRHLCDAAKRVVSSHYGKLQSQHSDLMDALNRANHTSNWFKRGVSFAEITRAVAEKLEIVRHIMDDTSKCVTDDAIQDLENRVDLARTTISAIQEEYQDILDTDRAQDQRSFVAHLQKLKDTYDMICDWVVQVRTWFIEAERIRKWIGEHISIIEHRDEQLDAVEPLGMELPLSDEEITYLYNEHSKLRTEIDQFNADDMERLRSHVLTLTTSGREKELSPADTSIIEITLTTINMLDQLMRLLENRSNFLKLLYLRSTWENHFASAVKWIAATDDSMSQFLRKAARWKDSSENIEDVVSTLVTMERKIVEYDQTSYTEVLDAYQEMEDLAETVTEHLEARQDKLEKAFEDLMKRSAFCRKVVEQHLAVTEVVNQYRLIREQGEQLRKSMIGASELHERLTYQEEEDLSEKVQTFKEKSAYLITHFASRIPYPDAPEMSTAIGSGDEQDNHAANEAIRSTISTYGMSLALIAEGLEQILTKRQHTLTLQQRAKLVCNKVTRLTDWMEDRIRILNSTEITNSNEIDEDEIIRLDKEREGIATRLNQIEFEELANALQEVRELEVDVDKFNVVAIDRGLLINCIEGVEKAHQELGELLKERARVVDVLKRRVSYQALWTKANHVIVSTARKGWDLCIKKARYDPRREDADKPSYANDNENSQAVQNLYDRQVEIEDRHMAALRETFQSLTDVAQVNDKQSEIEQKFADLHHLITYTSELLTQRAIITEFLMRVQDTQREGEKIKDSIVKMTRRGIQDDLIESRTAAFRQEVKNIWDESGSTVPFPTYQGSGLLRSLQPTETSSYSAEVKAQVKDLLNSKIEDLYALQESIDKLLQEYLQMHRTQKLAGEYDSKAEELQQWLDKQAADLKQQYVDVAADDASFAAITSDMLKDLEMKHAQLIRTLKEFEQVEVKSLHDKVARLMELANGSNNVDLSVSARRFGEVISSLDQLKESLADHKTMIEAAMKRMNWQDKLRAGRRQIEAMTENLRQFNNDKNKYVTLDDFSHKHVEELETRWNLLIQQKHEFVDETMPIVEQSYEAFAEYFSRLARPIATPDYIEALMESFNRATNRFEDNLNARSRELELVKTRADFDDRLEASLTWLQTQQVSIEALIEQRLRWHPESTENADTLREICNAFNADFTQHCQTVLVELRDALNGFHEAASSNGIPLVSESVKKKMVQMESTESLIRLHLDYANALVTQTSKMGTFVTQAAELEKSAEGIREDLAAYKVDEADHGAGYVDRLDSLKRDIDRVATTDIPHPTRISDLVPPDVQLKDESKNTMIREVVDTKTKRLYGIYASLEHLIESKEGVSRRKYIHQMYLKNLEAFKQWTEVRKKVVNDALRHKNTVAELREAISQIEGVEAAMDSHENVWTTLTEAYLKCYNKSETVQDQYKAAEEEWSSLRKEAKRVIDLLREALLPAEVYEGTQKLLSVYNELEDAINHADTATVSDDQISEWQKKMDGYESEGYAVLLQKITAVILDDDVKNQMELVAERTLEIRALITGLYDAVNASRLQKTLAENAEVVQERIKTVHAQTINSIEHNRHFIETFGTAAELREEYSAISLDYREMMGQYEDCKESFDDIQAYYHFIRGQIGEENDSIKEVQSAVEAGWEELTQANKQLSIIVARTQTWVKRYEELESILSQIDRIEDDMEQSLDAAMQKVRHVITTLDGLIEEGDEEHYKKRHAHVVQKAVLLATVIKQRQDDVLKNSFMASIKEHAARLSGLCSQNISVIRELRLASDAGIVKEDNTEVVSKAARAYEKAIDNQRRELSGCEHDIIGLFAQQCKQLVEEYGYPKDEADSVSIPVRAVFEEWALMIEDESRFTELLKLSVKQAQLYHSARDAIATLTSAVTGSNCVENMADLRESLDEAMQPVQLVTKEIQELAQKTNKDERSMVISGVTKERLDRLIEEYNKVKSIVAETLARIDKAKRHREVSTKIADTMRYVESFKTRAEAIRLQGMVTVEKQELQELEQEVADILAREISVPEDDQALQQQRKILEERVVELQKIMAARREEATTQIDISGFMKIVDDLEERATLLAKAVEDAAPHHASIVNNEFNKTDLQNLLKNLVAAYKEHEPKMTALVRKAKTEAAEKYQGNSYVSERLSQVLLRCNKIRSSAPARERELQTCISQLDHDFFTKLAMAKTKPRRAGPSPSGSSNARPPTMPVPMNHRSSSQGSAAGRKSPNNLRSSRVPNVRPSKTPSASRARYVADPKNELDIELGRIVNENPYRVKVKMVPGEVGKYWFGETTPRLVYCRILPSKLVMVRVGGGWVELSKFLHDHNLTEGTLRVEEANPVSTTSSSESSGGSLSSTAHLITRAASPSGRVSIRGGGLTSASNSEHLLSATWSSSSSRRSKTPRGGYVDGDKYIRVDEAGNQLMVRMTKAEDGAKMPINKRR